MMHLMRCRSVASSKVIDRDKGWNKLMRRLRKQSKGKPKAVKVGIQGALAVEKGNRKGEITNVNLAAIHEFGIQDKEPKIPSRSFIRSTFDKKEKEYRKQLTKIEVDALKGRKSVDAGLFQLGLVAVGDIQDTIDRGIPPPLEDSTSDRKGHTLPLVETGELRGSISSELLK